MMGGITCISKFKHFGGHGVKGWTVMRVGGSSAAAVPGPNPLLAVSGIHKTSMVLTF